MKLEEEVNMGLSSYRNLTVEELIQHVISNGEGSFADTGALICQTGTFTGRSPKDRFIVDTPEVSENIWWGEINQKFDVSNYKKLKRAMLAFLEIQERVYITDKSVCADKSYNQTVRVYSTKAWHSLFVNNMFISNTSNSIESPDFTVFCIPEFEADPEIHGTRNKNFTILNLEEKTILIGGTEYSGEIKKGIFSALNYLLPIERNVFPMHCSANVGSNKDTAIFFGLSGTGKTTLSADPRRLLIGDDEHGWSDEGIFNFEGGCYAKVIDLSREKEPQIWNAIHKGAILENVVTLDKSNKIDYTDKSITENTRVSYPLSHIMGALEPSVGNAPTNVFFLTADAFGVFPPVSKLSYEQAMYYFVAGYTAKVAGTEMGITEPKAAFSACFGEAFMPLHPFKYSSLLKEKLEKSKANVWLINTGWIGGPYGVGNRISLKYTRAIIDACLRGELRASSVDYQKLPIFDLEYPTTCPGVPSEILNPQDTWNDSDEYLRMANDLVLKFIKNMSKYEEKPSSIVSNEEVNTFNG